MSLGDFLQSIHWPATMQLASLRIAVAALVWPIVMLLTGPMEGPSAFLGMIAVFAVFLIVALAVAIPAIGIARAGVPFIGLLALPAWLLVIGNPIIMALQKAKPEWVPVDQFSLTSPPVLTVHK